MFLLLRNQSKIGLANFGYLHSTMFLLLLNLADLKINWKRNLHSTMFLLLHAVYKELERTGVFTFHYVSITTAISRRKHTPKQNLHSTMFLLLLKKKLFTSKLDNIYIPLCFYYYCSKTKKRYGTNYIYIPLCFYYYTIVQLCSNHIRIFTFHYVSITTTCTYNAAEVFIVFTFHYVSITTYRAMLHCKKNVLIYIPLCFYYYVWAAIVTLPSVNVFTFHYVSITTNERKRS